MIAVTGDFGRDAARHHFLTKVGVGHDAEFVLQGNKKRGDLLLAHQARRFTHRSVRIAKHGWRGYEVADADGAYLRQPMNSVPSAREPLTHGPGNEDSASGTPENSERRLSSDDVTRRIHMRPDGEGRG